MIVYFTAPTLQLKKKMPIYNRIIATIHKNGHVLGEDWRAHTFINDPEGPLHSDELYEKYYHDSMKALQKADVLIAEATDKATFGVGYVVSQGLLQKKPTLLLRKEGSVGGAFVAGLKDPLLNRKSYTDDNLEKCVTDFLMENARTNKDLRFNFVLDRHIYNHLHEMAYRTGKTKAEVIRDLVVKDMEEEK